MGMGLGMGRGRRRGRGEVLSKKKPRTVKTPGVLAFKFEFFLTRSIKIIKTCLSKEDL